MWDLTRSNEYQINGNGFGLYNNVKVAKNYGVGVFTNDEGIQKSLGNINIDEENTTEHYPP